MKILVFGKNGQLARALRDRSAALPEARFVFLGSDSCDFNRPETAAERVLEHRPDWVINASAYTQVDQAESDRAAAYAVNAKAPEAIAKACQETGSSLVHVSTDFVFDGSSERPWTERDAAAPLNAYGESKLAGERAIQAVDGSTYIFRTAWVYDAYGANFVTAMLRHARLNPTLKVVDDQFGNPTYAPDLAQGLLKAILLQPKPLRTELYHLTNAGVASRLEWVRTLLDLAKEAGMALKAERLEPVPSSAFKTPARRPRYSALDPEGFRRKFGFTLRPWAEALKDCIDVLKTGASL